jgi:hypothetical protein
MEPWIGSVGQGKNAGKDRDGRIAKVRRGTLAWNRLEAKDASILANGAARAGKEAMSQQPELIC